MATSVHAGHGLRPEIADAMVLDEGSRLREEDPFTDRIAAVVAGPRDHDALALRGGPQPAAARGDLPQPRGLLGPRRVARRDAVGRARSRAAWRRTTPSTTPSRRGSTPSPSAVPSSCSTCTPTTTAATARTSRPRRWPTTPRSTSAPAASTEDLFGPLVERFMGDLRRPPTGSGPARRAGERRLRGSQPGLVGARPLPRRRAACSRWSSRRPSWTSGPASSTRPRLRAAQERWRRRCPGCVEELEKLR